MPPGMPPSNTKNGEKKAPEDNTPPPTPNKTANRLHVAPESPEEQRLAVYRAVRDAGSVPEDAAFFLVSWQIDAITLLDAEMALRPYEERVEALRQNYGLDEDEPPIPGKGPPEYEEAQNQV